MAFGFINFFKQSLRVLLLAGSKSLFWKCIEQKLVFSMCPFSADPDMTSIFSDSS